MHRRYWRELEEVKKYLDGGHRKTLYIEFQKQVKQTLAGLSVLSPVALSIANVYSREDKQKYPPLKADEKIALKLYKWRKRAKQGQSPKVSDIHDITGVSIICPYPSDTDLVSDFLIKRSRFEHFEIAPTDIRYLDPKDNKGYRAYHGVCRGRGRFSALRCEIQIKTLINESWGVKTHDLTYKPPGDIDLRLNMHMEKLTFTLQLLDEQSEIVKNLMVEAWALDKKRREAAQQQVLISISDKADHRIRKIINEWKKRKGDLATSDLASGNPQKIESMIDKCIAEIGYSMDVCRVACLYATTRSSRDRNDWAIAIIDNWIDAIADPEERRIAGIFRSVANLALGEYEEAIADGRAVVTRALKSKKSRWILQAKINLAYFLAEGYYHRVFDEATGGGEIDRADSEKCRREALRLTHQLRSSTGLLRVALLDTKGAVLIACGDSEAAVREGMELCARAVNAAKHTAHEGQAQAFYALHERRAFRRLLNLDT
jgi:ppGpp synthetase/RelA/SpoT-type nucleotidyltranferase